MVVFVTLVLSRMSYFTVTYAQFFLSMVNLCPVGIHSSWGACAQFLYIVHCEPMSSFSWNSLFMVNLFPVFLKFIVHGDAMAKFHFEFIVDGEPMPSYCLNQMVRRKLAPFISS